MVKFLPLLSALLLPGFSRAQAFLADTSFLQTSIRNSGKLYTKTIEGQTALYNGSEYKEPERTNDQHPFFMSEDWELGSVDYNGSHYDNVYLLFDISSEKVITENFYSAQQIVLVNEKLSGFTLGGHRFLKLKAEDYYHSLPKSGFYELLYDGATRLIARRQKFVHNYIEASAVVIDFDPKDRYFLLKNGYYFPVKSKSSILKILEDEKRPLKQFIKKNKINFKQNRSAALAQVAAHYDILKKQP